jgi:hypothetical protein
MATPNSRSIHVMVVWRNQCTRIADGQPLEAVIRGIRNQRHAVANTVNHNQLPQDSARVNGTRSGVAFHSCYWPDGSPVPGYQRCGVACGEPPTSGDIQGAWSECIAVKTEAERREELRRR